MRITNCSPASRHFAYASSSGRTLLTGEVSAEISIQGVFNASLKSDLDANRARMRLSDKDRQFIAWLLAEDSKEIVVAAAIPIPVKSVKIKKEPVQLGDVRKGSMIPVLEVPAREATRVTPVEPGKAKSLADLKQHNQAVKLPKAGLPTPGLPNFGQSILTKKESLENARGLVGGRI